MWRHCFSVKAVSVAHSLCLSVTLDIHHVKFLRHIKLSSVACLARARQAVLSTVSHEGHDFRGKKIAEHRICFNFFHNCLKCIVRRNERDIKRCIYFCRILTQLVFSGQIFEKCSDV